TWNPVKINFVHVWLLAKDAWHTKSWKDKLRIWWMPTGWRPADVVETYPVYKIDDVYNFDKYVVNISKKLATWVWIQMVVLLLFVSYLFGNIVTIGSPAMFLYGGYIFLFVYAFTELMDANRYALGWEIAKTVFGIALLFYTGEWFGAGKWFTGLKYILLAYFILSCLVTAYLVNKTPEVKVPDVKNA
ncbi:MAG: sterol desaturase, partial [Bacteroidota bacterium]